tara:strand:- start:4211 stop:5833 length:1623 start_codon:yes stop_codon:yes gene_type:complete
MYKHLDIPGGEEIQFLKATKIPYWSGKPTAKVVKGIKKGSLTWVKKSQYSFDKNHSICIEDNRYGVNFDYSCFRPVDLKGKTVTASVTVTLPKYRFKSKGELMSIAMWDYELGCPAGWGTNKHNIYLGKTVLGEHTKDLEKGIREYIIKGFEIPSSRVFSSGGEEIVAHETEKMERLYKSLPKYRLKTEEEFKQESLWHTLGLPSGWGNDLKVNTHLGKGLPSSLTKKCDNLEEIEIGTLKISSDSYILCENDTITFEYLRSVNMIDLDYIIEEEDRRERESMEEMEIILEKTYDNEDIRKNIIPLFIGDPGLGKTKIIEKFAKKKGAKLVELITSQMSPFEISGIAMPDKDTKKMTYYNFDKMETLEDGDILFFDELLNGNPIVLNACLTLLEQRRLISGAPLPDIMIIAAANPQGMVPLTPQIKERFVWYNVDFSPNMWKKFMFDKYSMPEEISSKLCVLIENEKLINNNFYTPRSVDKAVTMILKDCPTPYETIMIPILNTLITNNHTSEKLFVTKKEFINPGESILWLDLLKKSKK